MAAPEDWVGRTVSVGLEFRGSAPYAGELSEVSDRGIVLVHRRANLPDQPIFYPWRLVGWIQPSEAEDRTGGQSGEEGS